MARRQIIWTETAVRQFNAAIHFIRKDSELQADRVKRRILDRIGLLQDTVVAHRPDPLKKNNDGRYLYFEVLKYRIVYYAMDDQVYIIRIRHTRMEPRKY